jgi:hypothetical protein
MPYRLFLSTYYNHSKIPQELKVKYSFEKLRIMQQYDAVKPGNTSETLG